jgi:hypothetical protein
MPRHCRRAPCPAPGGRRGRTGGRALLEHRTAKLLAGSNIQPLPTGHADGMVTFPAPALAQAIRRPERQARLSWLIRQPGTHVIALDRADATHVGKLLAASGTSDIADAHVVICARRASQPVVTSDPSDLRQLDPALRLIAL